MGHRKKASLKQVYYFSFLTLIVLPILAVFVVSMPLIHTIVRRQAIENIRLAQATIIANLTAEVQEMSMRLSHLVYTNDNEILNLAAGADTDDINERYLYDSGLVEASRLALVPVSDIVSVGFYMKSGRTVSYKTQINIPIDVLRRSSMYRSAIGNPNVVSIGSFNTDTYNNLYRGVAGGGLMLVAAIAPDVRTDRAQKIELVALYELSNISRSIQNSDQAYLAGKNSIGFTALVDLSERSILYASGKDGSLLSQYIDGDGALAGYTCLSTPVEMIGNDWAVVSVVKTRDLTKDFNSVALAIVSIVVVILLLFLFFSRYFLKDIITPVAMMRDGMKMVEDGDLDIRIPPQGNYEIRNMIHSFNAMVRRLKALIAEYEQRVRAKSKTPETYLRELMDGTISAQELHDVAGNEFFHDPYLLIGFALKDSGSGGMLVADVAEKEDLQSSLAKSFDRIPRFALRCTLASGSSDFLLAYYRIDHELKRDKLQEMLETVIQVGREEFGMDVSIIVSSACEGGDRFLNVFEDLLAKRAILDLFGKGAVLDLAVLPDCDELLARASAYRKAASALYIADEKVIAEEKDRIVGKLLDCDISDGRLEVLGFVLACAMRFREDFATLSDILGVQVDYMEKVHALEDARSLVVWLNNFISQVFEYSLGMLDLVRTDSVSKAKRYIADNYMRPNLSLGDVAEYVGLNEKYFTTKFSGEAGETFQSYVTGLRIQKAKELIGTTSFKMYEISQMVGYSNAEHFNRIFKKEVGISPNTYRKSRNSEVFSRN